MISYLADERIHEDLQSAVHINGVQIHKTYRCDILHTYVTRNQTNFNNGLSGINTIQNKEQTINRFDQLHRFHAEQINKFQAFYNVNAQKKYVSHLLEHSVTTLIIVLPIQD